MSTQEKYITPKEARKHFGVSEPTFRKWLAKGAPHIRISQQFRVKLSEVESWIRGNNEAPTKDIAGPTSAPIPDITGV
jgi:excisionase family DNA binding protein